MGCGKDKPCDCKDIHHVHLSNILETSAIEAVIRHNNGHLVIAMTNDKDQTIKWNRYKHIIESVREEMRKEGILKVCNVCDEPLSIDGKSCYNCDKKENMLLCGMCGNQIKPGDEVAALRYGTFTGLGIVYGGEEKSEKNDTYHSGCVTWIR